MMGMHILCVRVYCARVCGVISADGAGAPEPPASHPQQVLTVALSRRQTKEATSALSFSRSQGKGNWAFSQRLCRFLREQGRVNCLKISLADGIF